MLEFTKKRKYSKKTSRKANNFFINLIMLSLALAFVIVEIRFFHIATANQIEKFPIKDFSNQLSTQVQVLPSNRGRIFGDDNTLLAYDINTYTLIAYLNPSRTGNSKILYHIVDKQKTADLLAPILDADADNILYYLNLDVFQTKLGFIGSNITEKQRQEILELNLPGIEFVKTTNRIYPYKTFASYEIGYTKYDGESNISNGELGVEQYYNSILNGSDGSRTYVSDKYGYRIPGTPEKVVLPQQGKDIHLTINKEVQLVVESILTEQAKYYDSELISVVIAEAETGKIIASSSRPSFDPNIRNMELYLNPLVSLAFEPGSTMKTYTYAAAMEEGVYDGAEVFESGSYEIGDDIIKDWKREGWGEIDYDFGFIKSSNVGVTNLVLDKMSGRTLEEYYYKFGFGNKVEIGLPMEESGKMTFIYDVEVANAAFGQGITTTPIQHIQALMIIANNGVMRRPYLVEKVVDSITGEVIEKHQDEIIDSQVVSFETAEKIRELMNDVINNPEGTGYGFKVNDILIGKTGTAQIAEGNSYSDDSENYIYSFAGMFPKENPKYVMYAYLKRPVETKNEYLKNVVKEIVSGVTLVLGLERNTTTSEVIKYEMPNYIGASIFESTTKINTMGNKLIVLGDGPYPIEQYPLNGVMVSNNDMIVLKTSADSYKLPDLKGLSRYDAEVILKMLELNYVFEGTGFVQEFSLEADSVVNRGNSITVKLSLETE